MALSVAKFCLASILMFLKLVPAECMHTGCVLEFENNNLIRVLTAPLVLFRIPLRRMTFSGIVVCSFRRLSLSRGPGHLGSDITEAVNIFSNVRFCPLPNHRVEGDTE